MPVFSYKAKSGPGDVIAGSVQAESLQAAVRQILHSGRTPIDVQPVAVDSPSLKISVPPAPRLGRSVPAQAVAVFTRGLCDLVEAGMPLLMALQMLAKQAPASGFKAVLEAAARDVRDGVSLSTALGRHPRAFNALYINVLKSGESGGNLPRVLERLAQSIEQDMQVRARVKSALFYPCIILAVGACTVFVLLSFVLPRLTTVFEDFNADLPPLTKAVAALSGFLAHFWWAILAAAVAAGAALNWWMSTPGGRQWMSVWVLRLPLIAAFVSHVETARFARTLGVLLEAGVPIHVALDACAGVMGNTVFAGDTLNAAQKVRAGMGLTQALKSGTVFSELAVNLVMVGEQSGRLERGLYKLAQISDEQSRRMSENFLTVLGPLVLVAVVGVVGTLVAAVLVPMVEMNTIVK